MVIELILEFNLFLAILRHLVIKDKAIRSTCLFTYKQFLTVMAIVTDKILQV